MATVYPKFVSPSSAAEIFGVTTQTLRRWAKNGKIKTIRTPGGQNRYDVSGIPGLEAVAVPKAAAPAKKAAKAKPDPVAVPIQRAAPAPKAAKVAAPALDPAALKARIEALQQASVG